MSIEEVLKHIVSFDIEYNPEDEDLISIGVYIPSSEWGFKSSGKQPYFRNAVKEINGACRGLQFVLGHNIIAHDQKELHTKAPEVLLARLAAIDTLYLSPLAFPKNPYHRLHKNYKELLADAVNDPLADSKLAYKLLKDCCEAFTAMHKDYVLFYGYALYRAFPEHGFKVLFEAIARGPLPYPDEAQQIWSSLTASLQCCPYNALDLYRQYENLSDSFLSLAYALAWLSVAGGNSVVPAWVRHKMPDVTRVLRSIRGLSCGRSDCVYCAEHHDIRAGLKRYFGYESFLPVKDEDPPLQETIVQSIMAGDNCLAILPTGAGKSLCFQLPALMRAEQRSLLTLIISPLQSLMKDQVDGLVRSKSIPNAAMINGLLTPLERKTILEGICMGDFDLVWIAPEQLRNTSVKKTLEQRELGLVVIDEAHCLSKWGHDFRPDYLYVARYLKQRAMRLKTHLPQVACFTATAKLDVIEDIAGHFKNELDITLLRHEGGHERTNLQFEVFPVGNGGKGDAVLDLLDETFPGDERHGPGGAIVFTATRRGAKRLSRMLEKNDWQAEHFHGGRTPDEKRSVQDRFLNGELKVIAATNAFGMGVDKPDIRLVIHMDTPGSLENYLQEAGRAGRDRQAARCVLLFNPEDLDSQFTLTSHSRIELRDVKALHMALRKMAQKTSDGMVVRTSGEILNDPEDMPAEYSGITSEDMGYDTKVKIIISSLENSGKLVRGDNRTSVIQGSVLVENMEQAERIITPRNMDDDDKKLWKNILVELMNADPKALLNTDTLTSIVGEDSETLLNALRGMRAAKLINHDMNMTAFIKHGVQDSSQKRLEKFYSIEKDLLKYMEEAEPDAETQRELQFNSQIVAQELKNRGNIEVTTKALFEILTLWKLEGLVHLKKQESVSSRLTLREEWPEFRELVDHRRRMSRLILGMLIGKLNQGQRGSGLLVKFRTQDICDVVSADMELRYLPELEKRQNLALQGLHHLNVITLQSGLAVFRPAMTLDIRIDEPPFTKADFEPYENLFRQKTLQVHIMGKYAQMGSLALKEAMALVRDYFTMSVSDFLKRHFRGQLQLLDHPTSAESYAKIVTALQNEAQERIVTYRTDKNLLILAGPGSGKTRCIVHRIAYLIRVKRVPGRRILAMAFNRSAAGEIKKRLRQLIGKDAIGVRVYTYHALAMHITGRSLAGQSRAGTETIFDDLIQEAVELLREESQLDHGFSTWRDKLLGGLQYIMVDEYQDINETEYDFLSLLAGRGENEADNPPRLLAVGDDDQNIYAFTGANIRFIQRFKDDYDADELQLLANFRSLPEIVEASERLIQQNADRMKTDVAMMSARKSAPLLQHSPVVQVLRTKDKPTRLKHALEICKREATANSKLPAQSICVLCRTNEELDSLMMMSRCLGIKMRALRRRKQDVTRTREFLTIKAFLQDCGTENLKGKQLLEFVNGVIENSGFRDTNIWTKAVRDMLTQFLEETGHARRDVGEFIHYLYDAAREQRRQSPPEEGCVVAATMHSVKGLEFPVVIIPAQPVLGGKTSIEEERRLYYVGMSRAGDLLYCLDSEDQPNELLTPFRQVVSTSEPQVQLEPEEYRQYQMSYWDLSLSDVVISFPGSKSQSRRIQAALYEMEPGYSEGLQIISAQGSVLIMLQNDEIVGGRCNGAIAKLSGVRGVQQYNDYLSRGLKPARVTYMASQEWLREWSDEKYQADVVERWFTGLFRIEFHLK